jgi:hypothetical protein
MRKTFWSVVLTVVFLTGAVVTAQETSSKRPASSPGHMGPMAGMMGEGIPMKSMDHGAMMERMQGMEQMMEQCRQMMAVAHATEPSADR